jgi:magnesium transporter
MMKRRRELDMTTDSVRRAVSRVIWRRKTIVPGQAPGTLRDEPEAPPPRVSLLAYSPDEFEERELESLEEIPALLERWPVTWINVDGVGDAGLIARLGEILGLHPLALEDVVNLGQSAKAEDYDDHLFLVARMVSMAEHLQTEQVSFFVGERYILSFQECPGDCFEPVRDRIRQARRRLRTHRAGYLAYALLDALVDGYFPVTDAVGDRLAEIEDRVLGTPDREVAQEIQTEKSRLLLLMRAIRPHRVLLEDLLEEEERRYFSEETQLYLRDVLDHTTQVIDILESYREIASDLMSVHLSMLSNRMNEVMKVLTIVAAIFIPLGFIAGLYGMNFSAEASPWNMPELEWYWGYPAALLLMLLVAGGLLLLFRRAGWFR